MRSKWAAGKARGGRISKLIRNRGATRPPAHFHRNPLGRGQLAVFPRCSLLTYRFRYALRSRLEKQPTDRRRKPCLFRGQDTSAAAVLVPRNRSWTCISAIGGHQPLTIGLNRRDLHDRLEEEIKANIENARRLKIPNLICFSGNRSHCLGCSGVSSR